MAEKKKILYIVEAMGGGVFTYIVDLMSLSILMTCTLLMQCENRHRKIIRITLIGEFI